MSVSNKVFWISTNAMTTLRSGDRVNVGYPVRAPFVDVEAFVAALNRGGLITVERIDKKKTIALSAGAVASISIYEGCL